MLSRDHFTQTVSSNSKLHLSKVPLPVSNTDFRPWVAPIWKGWARNLNAEESTRLWTGMQTVADGLIAT